MTAVVTNYPVPAEFAARNWPINRPTNLATYVANFLNEIGFPTLTADDQARLNAAVNGFVYGTTTSLEPQ